MRLQRTMVEVPTGANNRTRGEVQGRPVFWGVSAMACVYSPYPVFCTADSSCLGVQYEREISLTSSGLVCGSR